MVFEIGTGSGILAIMAVKLETNVETTDTDSRALVTAKYNAKRNEVKIIFHRGFLFSGVKKYFDVSMANLQNEIVAHAKLANLDKVDAKVFDDRQRGNKLILALLNSAKQ